MCKKQIRTYSATLVITGHEWVSVHAALGFQNNTAEYALFTFFLPLAGSPEDLKDYFRADCKTEVVSGDLVGLYAGIQELPKDPPLSQVTTCRDVKGYSEALLWCVATAFVCLVQFGWFVNWFATYSSCVRPG
jgi:hypothetical protein